VHTASRHGEGKKENKRDCGRGESSRSQGRIEGSGYTIRGGRCKHGSPLAGSRGGSRDAKKEATPSDQEGRGRGSSAKKGMPKEKPPNEKKKISQAWYIGGGRTER